VVFFCQILEKWRIPHLANEDKMAPLRYHAKIEYSNVALWLNNVINVKLLIYNCYQMGWKFWIL